MKRTRKGGPLDVESALEIAGQPGNLEPSAVQRLEFRRNFREITKHSAVFFSGTIFTLLAGYFVKIYVARVLGPQRLGLYALGMTVVSFVQLFGLMGLPGTAARYVAVYNRTGNMDGLRALLSRSTTLILCLNAVLGGAMVLSRHWVADHIYHAPELARYMTLFALLMFLGALQVFYSHVIAGFKDIAKRTLITNFIGTPFVLLLTVLLLALGMGLRGYIVAQIVNAIVIVLLLARLTWRLTPTPAHFSLAPLAPLPPEILSFSGATFGMSALDFLVSQADKILLGFYLDARQLGIYVLASTLVAFMPVILQSINQMFAPAIAELHAQAQHEVLGKLFRTLTKWVLGATLPAALVAIVFAPPLMRIFGADFEPGWPVLVIGVLGQIVNCGVGSVGYLLLMSGNQNRLMRIQFISAALSIALSLMLIPLFGMVGAALSAAAINIGSNVWNLVEVNKCLRLSPGKQGYFALLLPTALAVGFLWALRVMTTSLEHQWIAILSGLVLSYAIFGAAAMCVALDADDRIMAHSAWIHMRNGFEKLAVRV